MICRHSRCVVMVSARESIDFSAFLPSIFDSRLKSAPVYNVNCRQRVKSFFCVLLSAILFIFSHIKNYTPKQVNEQFQPKWTAALSRAQPRELSSSLGFAAFFSWVFLSLTRWMRGGRLRLHNHVSSLRSFFAWFRLCLISQARHIFHFYPRRCVLSFSSQHSLRL